MIQKKKPSLFLIPTPLGENTAHTIPAYVSDLVLSLTFFIVEHAKNARHHLKSMAPSIVLAPLVMYEINEHDKETALSSFLDCIKKGNSVGLLSDAGCPGIADPGATVVALAHKHNIPVVPLVGPSSIALALMASGMNGQSFTFHGYLDAKTPKLADDLKKLETQAKKWGQTQIFIETPYRNKNVYHCAIQHLSDNTLFGVAVDLTMESQYIVVKSIAEWKKIKEPDLHKRPAVFTIL
ncbi:MAG: SAM-dependent methyltransferase [Saprospiraceae bacterium]